jgi:hypothetical protein
MSLSYSEAQCLETAEAARDQQAEGNAEENSERNGEKGESKTNTPLGACCEVQRSKDSSTGCTFVAACLRGRVGSQQSTRPGQEAAQDADMAPFFSPRPAGLGVSMLKLELT